MLHICTYADRRDDRTCFRVERVETTCDWNIVLNAIISMGKQNKKGDVNNKKFYAVTRGLNCGIFLQLSQVQPLVDKYKGAAHRGFVTLNGAVNFMLSGGYEMEEIYVHEDVENGTGMESVVQYAAKTGNTLTGITTNGESETNGTENVDGEIGISDSETDEKFVDAAGDVTEHAITVFTDGCCLNNGSQTQSKAGIGVYWGSSHTLNVSEPILNGKKTNNTAELRAAIMAVQQVKEGNFADVVIKSDSQYVVNGITSWREAWERNNWVTSSGTEVENKDLWLKLVELNAEVKPVWQYVRREQNTEADRLAKEGAMKSAVVNVSDSPEITVDAVDSGCLVCKQEENKDMLLCSTCSKRVHFACSELPDYQIAMFKKKQRKYTCQLCVVASGELRLLDTRKSCGEENANSGKNTRNVTENITNQEVKHGPSCSMEFNSIREDVKDLKSTFTAFEQEILKLMSQLCEENVQTKIRMSEERVKTIEKEKLVLVDQIKTHENLKGEMNVQIQNLRDKNANLNAECEQLRKCIERRDESNRSNEVHLNEKNAIIANLQIETTRLKEENRILNERTGPTVQQKKDEAESSQPVENNSIHPTVSLRNRFERVFGESEQRGETNYWKKENGVYFSGHREPLSNFYRMNFKWRGQNFHSVEQAFQHVKAVKHRAHEIADKVKSAKHAGIAKIIGKDVKIHPQWDKEKNAIMFDMLQEKVVQCKEFEDRLLQTGDKIIHEDVPDKYWGIGRDGRGLNQMGKILMEVRESLHKRAQRPKVAIIGSSLIKNLQAHSLSDRFNASKETAYTIPQAMPKVDRIAAGTSVVVYQLLSNDLRSETEDTCIQQLTTLVDKTKQGHPGRKL